MSYVAFDLDALNAAPAVARAASVAEEVIIAGMVRMWAWCFREKTDRITTLQVRGHFGADVAPALVAFGFLESASDGYRVKGADRYLRVSEQRQKAGRARAMSAGRSAGRFAGAAPAAHQRETSDNQRRTSEKPALTPSTEHRAPNALKTAPASRTPRDSDLLMQDFKSVVGADYAWQGAKDGAALARLLKQADLDEIRRRWRVGLQGEGWLLVRTVAQLAAKWNDLTAPPRPRDSRAPAHPSDFGSGSTNSVTEGF